MAKSRETSRETDDEKEIYDDASPFDWARRWGKEFEAAKKRLKKFHSRGREALKRFRDDRSGMEDGARLNLYTSDTITKRAVLYGKKPSVSAARRHGDAKDDVARVGGLMLERILNTDIEKTSDNLAQALGLSVDEFLKPGLGTIRMRYVAKFEAVEEVPAQVDPTTGAELAPLVPAHEKKTYECVEADHENWEDVLWDAAARVPHEVGWRAFKNPMGRKEMVERFGDIGRLVPLNREKGKNKNADPWGKADVWEIHFKEGRETFWYVEGFDQVLDRQKDALGLEGYWTSASIMANLSSDELVPVCDYYLARDLYKEIDNLTTRITLLESAIRVIGFYDAQMGDLSDLFDGGAENVMLPLQNWALHREKGGLAGAADFFDTQRLAETLRILEEQRERKKNLLHEVTGWADIMRGGSDPRETLGAQQLKARFGSARVQATQDLVAEFASELMGIKAEIIARQFDPETIIKQSNIMQTDDAHLAQEAAALIKSDPGGWRIVVKPESVNLTDMSQLKQETTEYVVGLGQMTQAMMPLAQVMGPPGQVLILRIGQALSARMRGGAALEGIFDDAVAQVEQAAEQAAAQPPRPDPKVMAQEAKAKGDIAKIQIGTQAKLIETQAKTQGAIQEIAVQGRLDMQQRAMDMQASAMAAAQKATQPGGES